MIGIGLSLPQVTARALPAVVVPASPPAPPVAPTTTGWTDASTWSDASPWSDAA